MVSRSNETQSYVVRPGDSFWGLAQRFHTTVPEIAAANPGQNAAHLRIGQTLQIPADYIAPSTPSVPRPGQGAAALRDQLRLLWTQHVYWTRMVILSIAFSTPDAAATAQRLLQNPKDFEALFRPFYGAAVAAEFADLLTAHLNIAAALVKASKAGDSAAAAAAERQWYQNADEIAAFLNRINPFCPQQEWKEMMHRHLALTQNEANEILTQKYEESIRTFNQIEQQALKMADVMAQGITRQFS